MKKHVGLPTRSAPREASQIGILQKLIAVSGRRGRRLSGLDSDETVPELVAGVGMSSSHMQVEWESDSGLVEDGPRTSRSGERQLR